MVSTKLQIQILLKIWINRYHIKTETNYAISNIAECYLLSNLTAYGFIWRREETLFEKDFLIKVKNIAGYKNKSILQLSLKGELVKEWYSAKDVETNLGIFTQSILNCCKGLRKTAGKFIRKYKN